MPRTPEVRPGAEVPSQALGSFSPLFLPPLCCPCAGASDLWMALAPWRAYSQSLGNGHGLACFPWKRTCYASLSWWTGVSCQAGSSPCLEVRCVP